MMRKLVFVLIISLFLFAGCSSYESRYNKLLEEYEELEIKYDSLNEQYYHLEDDYTELYVAKEKMDASIYYTEDLIGDLISYFEDKSISFDAAYHSFQELKDTLYDYY